MGTPRFGGECFVSGDFLEVVPYVVVRSYYCYTVRE